MISASTWLLGAILAVWLLRLLLSRLRIPTANDASDPRQQLAFVAVVSFEKRPQLNKSEFLVLEILEHVVRELCAGHRVMAQTSLGEIMKPKDDPLIREQNDLAFRSINSKRAGFVIVDARRFAVVVVEY